MILKEEEKRQAKYDPTDYNDVCHSSIIDYVKGRIAREVSTYDTLDCSHAVPVSVEAIRHESTCLSGSV